jgi:hypothetical protein
MLFAVDSIAQMQRGSVYAREAEALDTVWKSAGSVPKKETIVSNSVQVAKASAHVWLMHE